MKGKQRTAQSGAGRQGAADTRRTLILLAVAAAYCLLACIGLFVYSVSLRQQQVVAGGELTAAQVQLERASRLRAAAEVEHRSLADEQEQNRSGYSGPEAVEMSLRVQDGRAEYEQRRQDEAAAQSQVDALLKRSEALAMRWVPVIAVLLLHLLGLLLLSNRAVALRRD